LSSAQTKAALKPFYFAVHPDLFGQYPLQRVRIYIYIFFCFWCNVYIKELYICNLCTKEDKIERRSSLKMWHFFSFRQWKASTMITGTSTVTYKNVLASKELSKHMKSLSKVTGKSKQLLT